MKYKVCEYILGVPWNKGETIKSASADPDDVWLAVIAKVNAHKGNWCGLKTLEWFQVETDFHNDNRFVVGPTGHILQLTPIH